MSVGPVSIPAAVAGSALAQTRGADLDRAAQASTSQDRQATSAAKADAAAGVGTTDADSQTSERDADGRRAWEQPLEQRAPVEIDPSTGEPILRKSKDATGQSGGQLDLSG